MSPLMVNSDNQVVALLLSKHNHVCDMSGLGGVQSLFAIGAAGWMGPGREMMTVLTMMNGELHSATIDN